jgi:RNA polymerase sigma factor (sigma-70 family)
VSSQNFNPAATIDLENLVAICLPDIYEAVRWACLRCQGRIRQDELDHLSQQIVLKLIKDDCRLLRSFKRNSLFKTWLQAIVNRHTYKYFRWLKHTESPAEVDLEALIYPPPQDRDIYTVEMRKRLFSALRSLSAQERLLYHLWFVCEYDPIKRLFGICREMPQYIVVINQQSY